MLAGRVYLAGGYSATGNDPAVLSSSDGRRWSTAAELALPVRFPAVVADRGAIFVVGGEVLRSGVPAPVAQVQEIVPGERRARVVAELPVAVSGAEAWVAAGSLYVAGGDTQLSLTGAGSLTSGSIWSFDPRRHLFELAGELSQPVSHAGVTLVGGTTFLVGGEFQGQPVASVQEVVRRR